MRGFRALALLSALLAAHPTLGAELRGRVIGVADGDTLTVSAANSQTYRIRLLAIDAPEKNQPHADDSRGALAKLTLGRNIQVGWNRRDRYGRLVGRITINGTDIGLTMIRNGYAWHFKRYQSQQSPADQMAYDTAEVAARNERRGLWSDANPLPPWIFRKS